MSNGNLSCSATNCGYNNSRLCYAGAINVTGENANTTSSTYCSTFVEQDSSSFTNCANCSCTKPDQIKCEAKNCTYNESGWCHADSVHINAQNASCETFISR